MSEIKTRICLWYNGDAEEAFEFYARTFPDTRVENVQYAPSDYPAGEQGDALVVTATIVGIPTIGLNGGAQFPQSEAFSFMVITEDQEQTDCLWNAVVDNGGEESQCGWCRDKWGLNWQITPRVLLEAQQGDPATAKRVFEAMMTMKKIDVAA
ncbi:MAG: 3-demethylubiquinone-9 3-methyltransferase, partial [Novosphingobium sp.]|nr:3-demethylubiquinone-9 3-methyltransferase [Novosphingobium sp.]